MDMSLTACDAKARQQLVDLLQADSKSADYVAKTFPDILIDVVRLFTEQATDQARMTGDLKSQLKPFFMFSYLLGKCPQLTGPMYSYFDNSSFQPLPKNLFKIDTEGKISYSYHGFTDELVIEILLSYIKYLTFNPKWFSSIWNWSELGKFINIHINDDIRYLATCCLSIITKPTRREHISFLMEATTNRQKCIDLQIKYRYIYENSFKPRIETKKQHKDSFVEVLGSCDSGYSYCPESIAKVANILLLKREIGSDHQKVISQCQTVVENYIPVPTLEDAISKIAYSISISRPCLIRGPCGAGKTAVLDYIAALTNRLNPPDFVKVQIGDQIDSKLLIGSYTCTEIPGQFEWQPGPLTKAMTYGSWIVFEDIDLAPPDMAQVIHSVIENGNLSCVSSCPIKLDSPHPDFRIFFTQRTHKSNSTNVLKLGFGFIERQCDIIDLPDLSDADLKSILETRYKFGKLTDVILQLYRKAEEAFKNVNMNRALRALSLRDLFKLCDRLLDNNLKQVADKYTTKDLESVFIDAVECFLLSLPRKELQGPAEEMGQVVNFPSNEVQRLIFLRRPDIQEETDFLVIGRATLYSNLPDTSSAMKSRSTIAYTKQTLQLIESISVCLKQREPVLLVGETGVGKTSIVQHLANLTKSQLVVINLSQQSDSSDLLGGFKPVQMREVIRPINTRFEELFKSTFDVESNQKFLSHVNNLFITAKDNSRWSTYLRLIERLCVKARGNKISEEQLDSWKDLQDKSNKLAKRLLSGDDSPMALAFSDGSLMRAVKEGNWILLDEINLAEPDVLQCLILILDSINKSHVYMHNADQLNSAIKIHPNFRLFACMNPSTDIGKRDLAPGTRSRFREFFVDDIVDKKDLILIVESYVKTCLSTSQISNIVDFYLEVRDRSSILSDISGNSPVYSLRTLCRALTICADNICRNMEKSLLESLKITFLQQLNQVSITQILRLIEQTIFNRNTMANLNELEISMPKDNHDYVQVRGFWIQKSNEPQSINSKYIVTKSVNENLKSLARIISLSQRRLPILIQGNTSVGKTSLIMYLAKITGNKCYRINNHEHTDLQEYVGRYVLRESGDLYFQEGLLVRAMKKGYWIILDELNLAPCELLEALNRVLDENRELFIPETRETIKAHSKFMLFATQNPPEEYAGRKFLSRAFRNRFVELHFDEIVHDELQEILQHRCEMPPSYASKIVSVMRELQMYRRESGCFNGKNGFMTLRDLFRWGERYATFKKGAPDDEFFDWDAFVASEGLMLLEGRVRTVAEANTVKDIIEKVFKRQLNREEIYNRNFVHTSTVPLFKHIYFSTEFKKLFAQLSSALKYKEPVLLCGQTGCGKTTACQLYAALKEQRLRTYNCHLNSESADFVGGVRPSRSNDSENGSGQMFPWINGPLVESMMEGAIFLMDEISLADDAVLERINSVLEPTKSITLTEKDGEEIFAKESFRLVATMNPGGDYGKKELSPALRNRFTEIYCHNTTDIDQIKQLIGGCLSYSLLKNKLGQKVLSVMHQFLKEYYKEYDYISIRDVLSWIEFINKMTEIAQTRPLSIQEAITDGAALVYFDQIGTCGHRPSTIMSDETLRDRLRDLLAKLVDNKFGSSDVFAGEKLKSLELTQDIVRFDKFFITKGPLAFLKDCEIKFVLKAATVRKNVIKIVRAMQLNRPILLEGDPGSGKTSVVSALARLTSNKLVRINLSEQTDISDLFGSDLPDTDITDGDGPKFRWHDGPMLTAIKNSEWVLLDEMNLASQSVLEGLNACFDHRGEIFISELNRTFKIDRSTTRIFACQNPYSQGAARKGLPQSFLNRFTSIFIEAHKAHDLISIVAELYPNLPSGLIENMIEFNRQLSERFQCLGHEFNLRDILYWCDLLTRYVRGLEFKEKNLYKPERFVQFVYLDCMRVPEYRQEICDLFEKVFGYPVYEPFYREVKLGEHSFILARAILPRKARLPPQLPELCILKYQMPFMESIAKAIEFNKLPIVVGESGVGKRSMIRILAGLTGNELNIIGANSEMDTVELLGSFEQKNFQRELVDLVEDAKNCVFSLFNSISYKDSASTWRQIFENIWATLYATSIRDVKLSESEMMAAYRLQLDQMKSLIEKLQPLVTKDTTKICGSVLKKIINLERKNIFYSESMYSSGSFEWIDSILVKSIREGTWLMIEDANLLNPATLDRLNSLVESNGSLCLNEKGSSNDGIEVLTPHPDFRLILTMDPDNGELSRAMRNRGVEIFVHTRFYFEDFLMLLNQNGFEPEHDKPCMTYCIMQASYDFHKRVTEESPEEGGSVLAYFGLNYLPTLTNQIRRGVNVDKILTDLLVAFYSQKGFAEQCTDESIREFVKQQMDKYRITYKVNLLDERYNWRHLRHDLVSLTGGDAMPAMISREIAIFFDDSAPMALKPDEMIECLDIVNTCTSVKVFLDLSTHGDFDYRKGFIREVFNSLHQMMESVNKHVIWLYEENMFLIESKTTSPWIPVSEMHVDTRQTPDIHYYLQSLDYQGTLERESVQNRWLLSLQGIMLRMIVELIEERSTGMSLWALSEQVRTGKRSKESLIRPIAEIAVDLYDLLDGLLRVTSNRCFNNETVIKMMPRFFWIFYFICKLRKGTSEAELIAICNQIPMLWTLTYQKVIVPIIEDCNMFDVNHKNKKFSNRIQHICEALDVTTTKPGRKEKEHYKKVVNAFATTKKQCETVSKEVDKFFMTLVARYTSTSQSTPSGSVNSDNLFASSKIWSSSIDLTALYDVEDGLLALDVADEFSEESMNTRVELSKVAVDNCQSIIQMNAFYSENDGSARREQFRSECSNISRRKSSLDQFAPIWQFMIFHSQLVKLSASIADPVDYGCKFKHMLKSINGIVISPRYYAIVRRYLQALQDRKENQQDSAYIANYKGDFLNKTSKDDFDMYATFLTAHFIENTVLDHQVVGWTRMRVTTTDLPALAPLIPEYSPIVSLVGSYCLDVKHLKLNAYSGSTAQLTSMLLYLWHNYSHIKRDTDKDRHDIELARKLLHLRAKIEDKPGLIGSHECTGGGNKDCGCLEAYIQKRVTDFEGIANNLRSKLPAEDVDITLKSVKLIYFGQLSFIDYAPIFTLDPSLRCREKLEVYKSELAHIKIDLECRNTLFYWKTGENLLLNEIDSEGASSYPFSTRILVDRRMKLENSIGKLRRQHSVRPKSDDGSLYHELRKEVQVNIKRCTNNIAVLINDLIAYAQSDSKQKSANFNNIVIKCRMLIKNLEKSIAKFQSDYSLYTDLITNYQVGMCFVLQGVRCLYARLEQKLQLAQYGFSNSSIETYYKDLGRVFSFINFTQNNMESVRRKLDFFPKLDKVCPSDRNSNMQSLLLHSVLDQLIHHITITPSDIEKSIPIVRQIADLFHDAWIKRKLYLEEQRKLKEDLYQYRASKTTVGLDVNYERKEFIDLCAKFPTYDHIYQDHSSIPTTSAAKENLDTEEKVINLNRSVDISMCIDICKAHYKFFKEASQNLLGQVDSTNIGRLPDINLSQVVQTEAEMFYTIIRHCIPTLDRAYDSRTIECHILRAYELYKMFNQSSTDRFQVGSLKSSIEILDENIFDIYHDACVPEALKFQKFISNLEEKITAQRSNPSSPKYENHPTLNGITKLTTRISSFLVSDPLMKFVTGSHSLLEKIEEWNYQQVPKEEKLLSEADSLIELIKSWREIEIQSWRNSLHRVKKKHIDSTLCDLWFELYEAFNNPILASRNFHQAQEATDAQIIAAIKEEEEYIYATFAAIIHNFLDQSTLGDYQVRLDLVFSFAIQMRFAGLYERARPDHLSKDLLEEEKSLKIDYDKLTSYVYNLYRQYQGLLEPSREYLEEQESKLDKELNTEIRIVNWQGRNLWEIKNNFRISHRKLNKVMNKYLELLRKPAVTYKDVSVAPEIRSVSGEMTDLEFIKTKLSSGQELIKEVDLPSDKITQLDSLKTASHTVKRLKELNGTLCEPISSRYIRNLTSIDESLQRNSDAVKSFHGHKVEEVVISFKDDKETKESKQKLCRQIYNSKKFVMQSIFKDLQSLGISHQRGSNSVQKYDQQFSALEPLRGMLQNKSRRVLAAATHLVDDKIIMSCNQQYGKLMPNTQNLLSRQVFDESLSSEQIGRVRGCAIDMVLNIMKQLNSAAFMYRHLMDVQAATTRLKELQELSSSEDVIIYNFSAAQKAIQQFNDLVGRACLYTAKLEELADCGEAILESDSIGNGVGLPSITSHSGEFALLKQMFSELDESNYLMTKSQLAFIKAQLPEVRKVIAEVSYELRDRLNCSIRNYMYSVDDKRHLDKLYGKFFDAMSKLLLAKGRRGTPLGAAKLLIDEAENKLKPSLIRAFQRDDHNLMPVNGISKTSNSERLSIRLRKVVREVKLAVQAIYKEELALNNSENSKPFNSIDSGRIEKLLRLDNVACRAGNCFITLNRMQRCDSTQKCNDIKPIVEGLVPILFIYTQNVASYLNIILTSLHLKLNLANQLVPYFTYLFDKGFGLPYKVDEEPSNGTEPSKGENSEDNVGFGEGQGDKDATKKLEFESQLDDLKTDDKETEHKDEEEPIEAHEDGVEMSDDIDAKANGPDESVDKNKLDQNDEDEAEEEQDLDELDKELGEVDQEENKLDEKLWDEKDDQIEEDDEEDLRETEPDASSKSEKETEMKAKADGLESRQDQDESNETAENDVEMGEDNDDSTAEGPDETVDKDKSDCNEEETKDPSDLEMELNQSSDQDEIDDNVSDEKDDSTKENGDQDDLKEVEQEAPEKDVDMETSDVDVAKDEDQPAEVQEEKEEESAEMGGDVIASKAGGPDETAGKQGQDQDSPDKEAEQDDQISEKPEEKQLGENGGSKERNNDDNREKGDLEEGELEDEDVNSSQLERKSSKRTLADQSDVDMNEVKRQRILDVLEETDKKEGTPEGQVNQHRHVEAATDTSVELIDLVSDDEKGLAELNADAEEPIFSTPVGSEAGSPEEPVDRNLNTSYNTNIGLLKYISLQAPESEETNLIERIDNEVNSKLNVEFDSVDAYQLQSLWLECTKKTSHLVHELCQQLQIVLQPTKMAKYKGDYKTGKRLNMRKIISYIASHYRRDKIWLRRTKPSKRTYNICLAVDNSSSMAENNCRQMTYQSLALLANALSLIEAGSLNVVSFGQRVNCIHEFGQPYADAQGAQWLRDLRFNESQTSYKLLLEHSCKSFAKQARFSQLGFQTQQQQAQVSQLLIIISDGRNVTSEEEEVKCYLKQLKSMGVLTLFVIIDDLKHNNNKSIVDVKRCVGLGANVRMLSYMELFPFPFYVLLRQLETMPSVLGDALRQWFELVSNGP